MDAALKQLISLRDAAVVTSRPDPMDSRRQLYTLKPEITLRTAESGLREMDFGCAVLRTEAPGSMPPRPYSVSGLL